MREEIVPAPFSTDSAGTLGASESALRSRSPPGLPTDHALPSWISPHLSARLSSACNSNSPPADCGGAAPFTQRLHAKTREALRRRLESNPEHVAALGELTDLELELATGVDDHVEFVFALAAANSRIWREACTVLHEKLDRRQDAIAVLLRAREAFPNDAAICCYLAGLAPRDEQFWLEEALNIDPGCSVAILSLADMHRRNDALVEAAQLYTVGYQQGILTSRELYHLGEVLVNGGYSQEGRPHLIEVLQSSDPEYHVHAALTLALSFALDQEHAETLRYCAIVQDCLREEDALDMDEAKIACAIEGITLMRMGDVGNAAEMLRAASLPLESEAYMHQWDGLINAFLITAETRTGDYEAAENCRSWVQARGVESTDVTVSVAYLRQAQRDIGESAQLLQDCLRISPRFAPALLLLGYISLCQGELDSASQLLDDCLASPISGLNFGTIERGAAHIYLCLAKHSQISLPTPIWTDVASEAEDTPLSGGSPREQVRARRCVDRALAHFKQGLLLRPDVKSSLREMRAEMQRGGSVQVEVSASSAPLRLGMLDVLPSHVHVLRWYFSLGGLGRPAHLTLEGEDFCDTATIINTVPFCTSTPTSVATDLNGHILRELPTGPGQLFDTGRNSLSDRSIETAPLLEIKSEGLDSGVEELERQRDSRLCATEKWNGGSKTLVATASTSVPFSQCPSRTGSCHTLSDTASTLAKTQLQSQPLLAQTNAAATEVLKRLPQEKVLALSDLRLEECIGSGRFSAVHRGTLVSSGGRRIRKRQVVVKTLGSALPKGDESAVAAADLLFEVTMCAGLRHPRIITFVGACLEPDHFALVTELAVGGNLHQSIHVQRRQFSRVEKFRLGKETLEAVSYLHSRRPPIAHLDVKSMNLLLDATDEHLQLCDFGLARAISPQDAANEDGQKRRPKCGEGSPRYMAPECHDSRLGPITEKVDVWSIGCVFIELFSGTLPFADCSNVQQILNIVLVHRRGPSVPRSVDASVRGAMACALAYEAVHRLPAAQVLLQMETLERFPE